jgi:hypothetical protein
VTAGNPDGPAERRSGMRNRGALLAAVAVFALAVVGLAVVGGGGGGDSSLPKLLYAQADTAADEAGARSASAMLAPAQPVEYRFRGPAPELPDEAPAYRLGNEVDPAVVARLATALGVERDAVSVSEGPGALWHLKGKDDSVVSGGGMSSSGTGVATATATATLEVPTRSEAVEPCPPCPPDADCVACGPVEPTPTPERPADLPTQADAEAIARRVFEAVALPADEVGTFDHFDSWLVSVAPEVGGLPVLGLDTNVAVGPKGVIEWAHGSLAVPGKLGDYPLVDAETALDRLRGTIGIGPRTLAADTAESLPPRVVEVTGAHLALQSTGESLLPAVVFESADGDLVPVPAVEDRYLDQPAPTTDAVPDPSGRGSGCTAAGWAATDDGGNAPLTVEVCGPSTAKVGEEVTFEVTVIDPDAPIHTETCEGPWAEFGDGEPTVRTTCAVVCKEGRKDDRSPGKHATEWRYTYEKAGTFTATFHYRSGPCTSGASEGTGKHTVVVR